MWTARIWNRVLAGICYRLGTALEAGIDIRRSLEREADRNTGITRRYLSAIRDRVAGGTSLSDALKLTGSFFPRLVLPLVRVGETTGHVDRIFLRLSEYYQQIAHTRRQVLRAIAWPLVELAMALAIVAALIMAPVALPRSPDGQMQDLLGWGLVGYPGLACFLLILAAVATAVGIVIENFRREGRLARWILAVGERLPIVGTPFTDLAMERVAWTLSLATNTAMSLQESMALALDASLLPRLTRLIPSVQEQVTRGEELHESLRQTGQLPAEFLDAVELGEQTGRLPEVLERLAGSFGERSRAAIQRLSMIAAVAVWMGVAILIISLIFQLYGNYLRTLQGFL